MPQEFARNTFLGFVAGAAVALGGFICTTIAARLLGPQGMGVFAYAVWCVTTVATVTELGIAMVLQRFIPTLRAEDKPEAAEGLVGAGARLSVFAAIVGTVLLVGWLHGPGASAMSAPLQVPRAVLIAVIVAWFIVLNMSGTYMAYLKGEQRFGEFARLSALSALTRLVVTLLGAWLFGVVGALCGYFAAALIGAPRIRRLLRNKPVVGQELRRDVVRFAFAGWSVGVISGLLWGRTEIVFLEHYSGVGTVGLFAVASMLADMAMQLPVLLVTALLPAFSEKQGLGAHDQIQRLYRMMSGILTLVVVPVCIGIAAIAPALVPLVFGSEFAEVVPVATVLLIAAAVTCIAQTTVRLIYSTGKIGLLLISNGAGMVGTITLGFLVIPHFGLIGAAWSRASVQMLCVVIELWYVTRRLGYRPPYRALGAITLAAILQGGVAYAICVKWGGVGAVALAVPAAIVVYLVAIRVFAVFPLVDPLLGDTVVANSPQRLRPVLSWGLKLVSPATKDPAAPD
ncbi:hypothetical protein A5724_20220 [Mycobacterium sp. ACS1612]|uniref:oligosaccharide flippase family protein n=1 Tax=Mycobacterium sp. ACS1612 TaxID=1834117 RepID=UPI0007FD0993|nr:oligosaccharide flippase family protein [Mycobacterium sp. ACS1612]OBF32963.1 hypothetical protein A5724_20220 [Mycobacterium sp. ACS1612]